MSIASNLPFSSRGEIKLSPNLLCLFGPQFELRELRKRQDEARRAMGEDSPPLKESPSLKHKIVDEFMHEEMEKEQRARDEAEQEAKVELRWEAEKNYMWAPGDFAPEIEKRALEKRAPKNCHIDCNVKACSMLQIESMGCEK